MLLFAYSRIVSAVLVVEDTTLIRVLRQCRDARLRSRALYCWKISAGETKSVCARLRSFFSPPVRKLENGIFPASYELSRNAATGFFSDTFHSFPPLERAYRAHATASGKLGKFTTTPHKETTPRCRSEVTSLKLNFTDPLALPS